jgi:CheY-like chemotaxis protein
MQMTTKNSLNRILIADDDPVIRHLVTAIVTKLGYLPVTMNDGREACRLLYKDADFEAAILDMSMPHLEGLDVIRYMRTEKRLMRIPIMLITAEQNVKLMADSFTAGAAAFLPKPFTPDQLRNVLSMLLAARTPSSQAA